MDSSYLVQAILQCEQTLAVEENNSEKWQAAFRNLGNLLQGMGQFDRAIIWHSLALESQPDLGEVYSQLGELHVLEENWSAALISFENASKHQPNSAQIYSSLAQIHGQLQQREAEMACWYRATEINPNLVNNSGYYKLAKALEQRGKISEAIACFQKAGDGENGIIAAHYDLGEIYQRQRKLEIAKLIYENILAIDPTEAKAQYKLGTIHLQNQHYDQAIDCFRQTIKNAPDFPWAYRDLVKTFLQLEKWDEAIATCYAIINLVEEYPWVYVHLGNALREKGRFAESAVNFQKACGSRGWNQCVDNDYFFTQDVFSYRIPLWEKHLKPLVKEEGIAVLEVGSYQGMSSCWLLDQMLTRSIDRLTCIEPNFDRKLEENIAKTGSASKVTLSAGNVHQLLASFTPDSFDLVHLQDKCKLTDYVEQNTILAWKLLKKGGSLVLNNYGWSNPAYPKYNPKQGIDRFLNSIKNQWELIDQAHQVNQLIIRKS